MASQSYLSSTDFSFQIEGRVKDGGRNPMLGFKCGDKYPAIFGSFLTKENRQFSQAFSTFRDIYRLLSIVESVANYPGEEKISRDMDIMRMARGGQRISSGLKAMVSRRADGLVSIRLQHNDIREAIFPILESPGIRTETRTESGTPYPERLSYQEAVSDWVHFWRTQADAWRASRTETGDEAMRDELRQKFGNGNNYG